MTTEDIKNEDSNIEETQENNAPDNSEEVQNDTETAENGPFAVGDTVTGTIFNIEDKFVKVQVDDSDYEGIIPISQLTNKRIEHPNDIIALDDSITAVVIKVEDDAKNIIISIRKLDEQKAYEDLKQKQDADATLEGTVVEAVKAGLVLDVGVRGFIPASLLSDEYIEDLEQFTGQTLEVKVEDIDQEKNRVILNRKRIVEGEKSKHRQAELQDLEIGSIIEGEVVRTTSFGAFINIGSVDGLAHISELSYSRVNSVEDAVEIGQKVNVKVLDVNPEQERISLSIKQAGESPFNKFIDAHDTGDVLNGTVKRLVDFGAFVEVSPGVEGLVHISEIAHDHVNVPSDVLKEEQEIEVKIIGLDKDNEKISLSIKALESAPARPKQAKQEQNSQVYTDDTDDDAPTLGDVFGDRFKDLDL
ncbi:30S ribosomal protein S1 [Jeotgalicoccus aerolatus]|uniref:Small subunit ribosomal protein S1 n=1 Tax=Jeotgalicoccus aerolatus TaxID=709510 RepID=A0A1G8UXD9_9STAP|nr:30S ribosomal protein S1 [Jeotgalicoccus aerolatus]MBP1951781.1 small subunit ribosomal protein S1 [Jeotgalicoccus aerolatus]GGD94832.1 30S ribosomal protein S1 [Jeotgalicoccus aerolatus]CAD2075245.1 30S ribosomal protein S1 [Jeotgalicoccus aerolatus]SDJ58237.1 small subunit ribosomal protein S1 [Jeotgalicoccus aerolatus]